jgi:hypothetical protein
MAQGPGLRTAHPSLQEGTDLPASEEQIARLNDGKMQTFHAMEDSYSTCMSAARHKTALFPSEVWLSLVGAESLNGGWWHN